MTTIILIVRLLIEVVLSCHCARWAQTSDGPLCINPKDHASCELIDGWHQASFGTSVCSIHCGDDS